MDEDQKRLEEARRRHDQQDKITLAYIGGAFQFIGDTLKAVALVNGGSAIALLTFLGTGRARFNGLLFSGLGCFAAGVFLSGFATLAAYASQKSITDETMQKEKSFHEPFLRETTVSTLSFWWAQAFQRLALGVILAVFGLAALGLILAGAGLWQQQGTGIAPIQFFKASLG